MATTVTAVRAVVTWDAPSYARIAQNLHDGIGNVTIRVVPNVRWRPSC